MELEMEIPEADELEWLEANSHQQDYFEEDEECFFQQPPFELEEDTSRILQSEPSPDPAASKKRPSSPSGTLNLSDEEAAEPKRSRLTAVEESDNDVDLLLGFGSESGTMPSTEVSQVEDKYLSEFASEIDGDCVSVTGPSGGRVYAKIERAERPRVLPKFSVQDQSGSLISETMNNLMQNLEQEAFMKALQASSETQHDVPLLEEPPTANELWVDKYAPRSFTELLSDEQTNREVLLWLKQWDSTVFGGEVINTSEEVLTSLRRHSLVSHHQKRSDTSFVRKNKAFRSSEKYPFVATNENFKSLGIQGIQAKKIRGVGPPDQKVLLLCGPPGLGKTTLAHVAAKHCGYRAVEINASDDRSSSMIETKILNAVQNKSVMGDPRPNCLVIDEIDGSLGDGKGAVDIILKILAAEKKTNSTKEISSEEDQSGKKSSKRVRKAVSLSRPVICICNDLYVPALRPLRQVAKVHIFAQPTVNRVVGRLRYICDKERMKASSIALTSLAEHTECDIRSCLNTLQFLHKKKTNINALDISTHIVGRKDMTKSVFEVWNEVFQKRKTKHSRKSDNGQINSLDAPDSLYFLVSNRGDHELIFDGIHENILQQHYHDPGMLKTVQCLDYLGISDLLHQRIMGSHNMSLYPYNTLISVAIHHKLAHVDRPTIEWPKSFHRYRTTLMEKKEILRTWLCKIGPNISRHLPIKSFIEDTLSLLIRILSPPTFRPVALHLLSEKERNDLVQLVCTMVDYSLTYKNIKPETLTSDPSQGAILDASLLSLDPRLDAFLLFKGYKPGHYELTSAVKQVLVHEADKQRILRGSTSKRVCENEYDATRLKSGSGAATSTKKSISVDAGSTIKGERNNLQPTDSNERVSSHLPTTGSDANGALVIKQKPLEGKMKRSRNFNFFERFQKSSVKGSESGNSPAQKLATSERDSRPLIFKFNEGFTNAVKRPVRIREFLM